MRKAKGKEKKKRSEKGQRDRSTFSGNKVDAAIALNLKEIQLWFEKAAGRIDWASRPPYSVIE